MRISFVGAGNVAWHLAQAFEHAGHHIVEVFSRDTRNARRLVNKLYDTHVAPDLDFAESIAELIVLAVTDDALHDVVSRLVLPEHCTVVHTSGTKSLDELRQLIEIYSDIIDIKLIDTAIIPNLKIYYNNFQDELKGWGSSISGLEISDDGIEFEITSYGLESETMSTLFKHHFDEYFK